MFVSTKDHSGVGTLLRTTIIGWDIGGARDAAGMRDAAGGAVYRGGDFAGFG